MTREHETVLDGLELGMRRYVADLFKVLMTSPDPEAFERFERGLKRAIEGYQQANGMALEILAAEAGYDPSA